MKDKQCLMVVSYITDAVVAPRNLTVVAIGTTRAKLIWIYFGPISRILRFELTYEWLAAPSGKYSVTCGIDVYKRQVTLRGLIPFQSYQVFMVSIDLDGTTSNTTNHVEFTTRGDDRAYVPVKHTMQVEEVIIISIIVLIWIVTVVVFWRRWDSIRILQPMEPRFKHNPKNLDTIKIVKRAQDSIIYKTYSRKLSLTMVAREKRRLQRMHTAPVLPTIHMEDVTTVM
ncbi:hypothetical protein SNE40_015501 [Patella caerulea]|uniref:Fibronectin type-III domain-containing protein n=1 Tax=Patella caerulea TaxID=87958 RepID=A0AAN8JHH3_PATCE